MLLEFIDRFLYERKIGVKLIRIHLCKAKMSVMRVGLRTNATSKMELFVTIVAEWKLSKIVLKSSISDVAVVLGSVCVI